MREDQLTIDSYILKCWRAGDDTYTIARDLKVREHVIANRLWHIRASKTGERHGAEHILER